MTTPSFYELMQKRSIFDLGLNPFSWYKQMRMTDPVSVNEQDQLCELFRYKDIHAILANPTLFSSKVGLGEAEGWVERENLISTDPPRHDKLRALVSQAFTPRSIAMLADTIRDTVNELLNAASASDTLEVMRDLATPLPIRVMAGMMGVPLARQAEFKYWIQGIVGGHSPEETVAKLQAFEDYVRELIVQKRQEKQDDLISALLEAQVDGEPLSEQEIVYFCTLLLVTGFETTTHLIGNTMLCLDDHPSARSQLWADPSLIPGAIEEVLRFLPVASRIDRTVTRDTEIGGKQIKAGYRLFAWVGSGNRDEEQWADPEVFDIRRSPNHHLSLGFGIHYCLGAPLVRLETRIALEQIIERFKGVQRIREVPLQLVGSVVHYGMQQLPLLVQKR